MRRLALPFGATGVFVRDLARVRVPRGGIRRIAIGLHGTRYAAG
jgi:hypothetical protein